MAAIRHRLLDKVIASQPANGHTDEGRLNALSLALVSLEDELREQIQAVTAAQISPLIDTLQADGPLGPRDLELIRLWLVGDAETYVKMESDLAAWIAELDRLLGVLRQLRSEGSLPPPCPEWRRQCGTRYASPAMTSRPSPASWRRS